MKSEIKRYSMLLFAIVMVLVSCVAVKVNAEEPTTGSITIIVHEQHNGDTTTNPPMEGIGYTLYKVDESCEDTWDAYDYIQDNQIEGITKITDENGTIVFDNLELGRYYIGFSDEVLDRDDILTWLTDAESFLVDIPMTNPQGNGWDYDILVEPKVPTALSNLELTKVDTSGNPIENVTFKLQVGRRDEWEDYILKDTGEPLNVTTDIYGKIKIENIPYDSDFLYKLLEVSAPNGYIINNALLSMIEFYQNNYSGNRGKFYSDILYSLQEGYYDDTIFSRIIKNVKIENDLTSFTYVNEKPEIEKKVQNSNGEFVDSISANATDRLTFKVTADVPMQIAFMKTYKIIDELPNGIILDRNSINIEGTTVDGSETIPEDMYTLSQDGLELTFDTSKMYNEDTLFPKYNNIIITYEVTIDKDNVVIGEDGNINTATLEYTNNIGVEYDKDGEIIDTPEISTTTTTDTAEVHTGGVLIEKVEKGDISTKLAGAKFKIATSESNAENGIFVQDETGTDIEVTTGDNGQAVIEGLKYADDGSNTSYWLVETQAPSYVEDGVTKYYNLLKAPLEVQVGKTTHESAVQIENGKGFDLPETGSIGLAIFTVVGVAVMSIAYVLNKKQKVQE